MAAGLNVSISKIYTYDPGVGLGQVVAGVPKGSQRLALTAAQRRQAEAAILAQPGLAGCSPTTTTCRARSGSPGSPR